MMQDKVYHDVQYIPGISPDEGAASNTAKVSAIADLANRTSCTFVIATGTLVDPDATFTVLFEDGDNSALSDNAAVADAFLLGTEAGASFTFTNDDTVYKIGYIGPKRYVRVTITPAANTGVWDICGIWALGGARKVPFTTQGET